MKTISQAAKELGKTGAAIWGSFGTWREVKRTDGLGSKS